MTARPTNGAAPAAPYAPGSHAEPPPSVPAALKAALVGALDARGGVAPAFDLARAVGAESLAELEPVLAALEADGAIDRSGGPIHLVSKGSKKL